MDHCQWHFYRVGHPRICTLAVAQFVVVCKSTLKAAAVFHS